jgi:hypothetical protein
VEELKSYLEPTPFLDFDSPLLDVFLQDFSVDWTTDRKAIFLYQKVRDFFLYDPYHLDLRQHALTASKIIAHKRAWCVEKSIVLAALARKVGIPSRMGYAIVTNHIGVEKLTSYLRRPEIVFHGYVSLYIVDKWIKCTPAFDKRICAISKVEPLDWDAKNDSMFQAFEGNRLFMEYTHFYGEFADVPLQLMHREMQKYYPHLFEAEYNSKAFSFHFDPKFL